jgi:hypothetical protein
MNIDGRSSSLIFTYTSVSDWVFFKANWEIVQVYLRKPLHIRWEGSCLIYVICVCLRIVVSNTYCVVVFIVFALCFMLTVYLDWPFLIAPSVFSNVYLPMLTLMIHLFSLVVLSPVPLVYVRVHRAISVHILYREGYKHVFKIPPDFDDTAVNLGLGTLLIPGF